MASYPRAENTPHFQSLGNVVPEGYAYYEKVVTVGQPLNLPKAYLKWYNLHPIDVVITEAQVLESRMFLEAEIDRLKFEGDLGFVMLHRAGSYLLLLLTTWRNTNEMWEAVYVKDVTQREAYEPLNIESSHRGTYCVWELAPVWHERNAWVRFLSSKRDEEAKMAYVNDSFSGRV